ncbi:MAG TPA: ImmA/IrrE family metallo-endopeptidase [Cytophagaceae bacterium]|jgi:Zn-dependent peptidase ImmA (M78 family)/transcriptional regulator with XRE-family HTH domain|nr:ImmA/IrrE family metallo-endopeptidase [Cytophagaceae bacterium]
MKIIKLKQDLPEFNHKLIAVAREQRGLGQKELAEKVEIDQGNISRIESGKQIPMKDTMEKIAKALNYNLEFFKQKSQVIDFESSFYRRRLKIPKKDLLKAEANINISKVNLDALLRMVELPEPDYLKFDLSEGGTVPDCAIKLREYWKLPQGYVANLTQILEKNGIVVISIDFEGVNIDGHAIVTEDNIPVIFINRNIPADRYRLTLAHELGHLALHVGKEISEERDVEKEAFLFAGEFMMPEKEIKPDLSDVSLESLKELKKYWKISMGALIKRASDLKVISDNQYKYLWQQMVKLGYKKREPEELDFDKEEPSIIRQLVDAHIDELEFKEKELAEFLGMKHEEFSLKYLADRAKLKKSRGGKA